MSHGPRIRSGRLAQAPRQRVEYPTGLGGAPGRVLAYKPLCSQSLSYLYFSLSLFFLLPARQGIYISRRRLPRLVGGIDGVVAEVGRRAGEARVDRRHNPAGSQERR